MTGEAVWPKECNRKSWCARNGECVSEDCVHKGRDLADEIKAVVLSDVIASFEENLAVVKGVAKDWKQTSAMWERKARDAKKTIAALEERLKAIEHPS